jgi:hypothetical protein
MLAVVVVQFILVVVELKGMEGLAAVERVLTRELPIQAVVGARV